MDIGFFSIGTPVRMTRRTIRVDRDLFSVNGKQYKNGDYISEFDDFGHVVGFDRNSTGEVIVVVNWSMGERSSVHPSNLAVFVNNNWVTNR